MNKERILVLGEGLLGTNFKKRGYTVLGRDKFEWTVWGSRYKGDRCLDSVVYPYGDVSEFDTIINTIAYTDTQKANSNVNMCNAVNVKLPDYLNTIFREMKLVHVSTGSVYMNPAHSYTSWEEDAPISVYAATKFLGESFVDPERNIVVRPQMVFGQEHRSSNLFDKLESYDSALNNYFSMTSTDTIVEAIEALLENEAVGVYNVANVGQATPVEAGRYIHTKFARLIEMNELKENKALTSPNIMLSLNKLKQYYEPRNIHKELERVGSLWFKEDKSASRETVHQ